MFQWGMVCGMVIAILFSGINSYSYKSTLLLKAQNGESEKILDHWVRLELEEK